MLRKFGGKRSITREQRKRISSSVEPLNTNDIVLFKGSESKLGVVSNFRESLKGSPIARS
ncbi:hypothetical protein J6590_019171 [Homalodisca vitripennis]|nr:hypothetical protein J6590_019171 [Homalodisca vitripennis]